MARQQSAGKCELCQGAFGKAAMTRHLKKCLAGQPATAAPASKTPGKLLHLVVQGEYGASYWLHVEVPASATFRDLDAFLRHIWLECCGHLSAFRIKKLTKKPARASSSAVDPFSSLFPWGPADLDPESPDMDDPLGDVLHDGMTFEYEYDFGSTTHLTLKVVGDREGGTSKKEPVRLLARNDPPAIPCGVCSKPATRICASCSYDESGWLCGSCAKKHKCGDDMFLPVVNSPRTGVCGYTGD